MATSVAILAWLVLFIPYYVDLSRTVWSTDEQGHGPIILAVSLWLIWRQREQIASAPDSPSRVLGWAVILVCLGLYALGSSQQINTFVGIAQIGFIAATFLLIKGRRALRIVAFPLFFLLFMIPLPEALVAFVTAPLKSAVSYTASSLLYLVGYPVGRSGVIMTVGPYQLLVADACAGLNSMFTLEALGMLYMNLMGYTSLRRNVSLALLLIPIAFVANVVRVIILVLVTYHFGDAAGQGFVHGFAGLVLFLAALMLMLVVDKLLSVVFPSARAKLS